MTQQLLDTLAYLSVLFHGAVLAAQATTVGGVAFAIFVARQTVLSSCRRLILWSASTLFVAQLALVVIQTISLMNSAELSLAEVAGAEFFVAGAVTLVAAALIIALTAGWWPRSIPLLAIASLGVIAASVMTTHSAARVEHRLPLAIATTFHLLATATWIGGLPYLISALTRTDDSDAARRLALRFSTLALVSVSVLFVAGSILAIVYVGSPSGWLWHRLRHNGRRKDRPLPWIAATGCEQFPPYQKAQTWSSLTLDRASTTFCRGRNRHRHHCHSGGGLPDDNTAGSRCPRRPCPAR